MNLPIKGLLVECVKLEPDMDQDAVRNFTNYPVKREICLKNEFQECNFTRYTIKEDDRADQTKEEPNEAVGNVILNKQEQSDILVKTEGEANFSDSPQFHYVSCKKENMNTEVLLKSNCSDSNSDGSASIDEQGSQHDATKLYKCDEASCTFATKFKLSLSRHKLMKHPSASGASVVHKCQHCGFRTRLRTTLNRHKVEKHLESCKDMVLYKCDRADCAYVTLRKGSLTRHVTAYHVNTRTDIYTCGRDGCTYQTKVKENFKRHSKTTRHVELDGGNGGDAVDYQCGTSGCAFVAKWKQQLKEHLAERHPELCSKQVRFKCHQGDCGFATNWSTSFKRHVSEMHAMHSSNSPLRHKCNHPDCTFVTKWRPSLKRHVAEKHGAPALYKCRQAACGYASARKEILKRHTMEKHPDLCGDLVVYRCEQPRCVFHTRLKEYLKKHMQRKHPEASRELSAVRRCDQPGCEFITGLKHHLEKHMLDAHPHVDTVVRVYKCDRAYCGFETGWKTSLKRHLVEKHPKHQDRDDDKLVVYQCADCGDFRTRWKGKLKGHMLEHHPDPSEKPTLYQCSGGGSDSGCTFSTRWKESLRRHTRKMHSGYSHPAAPSRPEEEETKVS